MYDIKNILVQPNWAQGVEESWEFKTDIFESRTGIETRSSLREFPRRETKFSMMAAKKNPDLRQVMGARQGETVRYPDIFRKTRVASVGGNVCTGDVDHSYFSVGRYVCVQVGDFAVFGQVLQNDSTRLTVDSATTIPQAAAATIAPCLLGRSPEKSSFSLQTSAISTGPVEYLADFDKEAVYSILDLPAFTYYRGRPLVLWRPNWGQSVNESWLRRSDIMDSGYGVVSVRHPSQGPVRMASYSMTLRDREAAIEILSFFSWCRGRQASFYAPTWSDDFVFEQPVVLGQEDILVSGQGVLALFESEESFDSMCIRSAGHVFVVGILAAVKEGDNTRVYLESGIPEGVVGQSRASWLLRQRFSTDKLSFEFLTNEVSETQIQTVSVFAAFESIMVAGRRLTLGGQYVTIDGPSTKPVFVPITVQGQPMSISEDFTA